MQSFHPVFYHISQHDRKGHVLPENKDRALMKMMTLVLMSLLMTMTLLTMPATLLILMGIDDNDNPSISVDYD